LATKKRFNPCFSHLERQITNWPKNGDELVWEEKFCVANGKAQACTQGALIMFPFKFFWGGGKGFFFIFPWFPMCSHYVHFKFSMGSQYVPPNSFTFILYALPNVVLLSPI
jgi:hypothetical protein